MTEEEKKEVEVEDFINKKIKFLQENEVELEKRDGYYVCPMCNNLMKSQHCFCMISAYSEYLSYRIDRIDGIDEIDEIDENEDHLRIVDGINENEYYFQGLGEIKEVTIKMPETEYNRFKAFARLHNETMEKKISYFIWQFVRHFERLGPKIIDSWGHPGMMA